MKTIKEALITLYSEILESYSTDNEFKQLRDSMTFYEFIRHKFLHYVQISSEIDCEGLKVLNQGEYQVLNVDFSSQNLTKFTKLLTYSFLETLQLVYKGNIYRAYEGFGNLMDSTYNEVKHPIYEYLSDIYQNCIKKDIEKECLLYRMRDMNKGERPKDCWHIPFVLRKYASFQRYNMYGIPCLYLADSLSTANAEIGELADNRDRWFSEFSTNTVTNKWRDIHVYDFTIPTVEQIIQETNDNYLFEWLITYPLRLLCSVKVSKKDNFCEEYMFPQIVFHWVYFLNNDCINGFKYSSTKNPGGINYVFPATYETKQPPTYNDKQISERLEKLFTASEPKLYKEGRSRKKYSIEITEL